MRFSVFFFILDLFSHFYRGKGSENFGYAAQQREDKFPEICGQFMPHGLLPALLATGYRVNDRHFTRRQVQLIFDYLGEP